MAIRRGRPGAKRNHALAEFPFEVIYRICDHFALLALVIVIGEQIELAHACRRKIEKRDPNADDLDVWR
ncbi:MAG TPA: hypothetical protein VMF67_04000 [Rhizomicrobium sp.]|nr:hypothetical protein [Rhizomicrobium sp.]